MQGDENEAADGTAIDILLVEDEAILAMVASEVLGDAGYRVRECGSAEEALALLDSGYRPAVLITDHSLPGMSGGALAQAIDGTGRVGAILIASGDSGCSDLGFPLLAKPYRDHELIDRVAAVLARRI